MENEKIVSVENGLNEDFFASLIEQAEIADDFNSQAQEDAMIESLNDQAQEDAMIESMNDQAQEDAMIDSMYELAMEDAMIEQAMEDAMIDSMNEQAMEDAMIDSMNEQAMEDAMIEQAMEDAMIEDMANGPYYSSKTDRHVDSWIAVYNDLSHKSAEDIKSLEIGNLLCFIHKQFVKTSKSGKTAYFRYQIIDKDDNPAFLKIGNYFCKSAEQEHWVSWEYDNEEIKEQHYFTSYHQNNKEYGFDRSFIYPIDYTFASEVPLNKFNPFRFSFNKLNFLTKNEISSCGDKLSRIKIFNLKGNFIELSIYDFENNIIPLLKSLNDSVSLVDFVIKIHLEQSVKYLEAVNVELTNHSNNSAKIGAKNIIKNMKKLLEKLSIFLPQTVKNNPNSDYFMLNSKFIALVSNFNSIDIAN